MSALKIVTRAEWGAKPPSSPLLTMLSPAPETWIHHAATSSGPDEAAIVRQIQTAHMASGYRDIGYNFLFGQSGTIYEGRGWAKKNGADGSFHDEISHTWCFIGNSNNDEPTDAALDAVREHIAFGISEGHIVPGIHPLGGHRDIDQTACPGDKLYDKLDYIRVPWKEDELSKEDVRDGLREAYNIKEGDADKIGDFQVALADYLAGEPRPNQPYRAAIYDSLVKRFGAAGAA